MLPADAPEMTLRPASEADAGRLLEWRNDPDARAASRNIAEVGAAEHTAWLAAVLADPHRQLLIGELDDKPVGQVRFDRLGEDRYEISVALAPAVRGQGLSSSLIALAVEKLHESSPGAMVEAHVRDGNDRSLSAFRGAGFRPTGKQADGFLVLVA
ncbi:MAG TPA: GNAT family N-acetyltransferase [Solirubrobacterales bacterium]|nr:GNAT family N-acetyltransferase [Solirubrobacterales bacterium]